MYYTHWTIGCGSSSVARTRTSDGGNRRPAAAAVAVADTRPPAVRTPPASVAPALCGDGRSRAAVTYGGDAGPAPPGPSLPPNGSCPTASRSKLPTLRSTC